jgi:hypothetical protein
MNDKQPHAARLPESLPAAVSFRKQPRSVHPAKQAVQDMRRRKLFVFVCLVLFVILVAVRVVNILRNTPEYDEIWTVQNYRDIPVRAVFSDVSTPNNHVLNTLGIRFFLSVVPHHNLAVRLTALLGFCALFAVLLRASLLFFNNSFIRGAVLASVLLNGMLLHYAETARGYSLQSFFVFGIFFSLLCFQFRPRENRAFNACMWFLCAVGACLSVSSGALYVVILTGLWALLYVRFRDGVKKVWHDNRPLILAWMVWSVLALAWYGGNYSQFAAGRELFGESFRSPARYFSYCFEAARNTGLLLATPCLAACGVLLLLRGKPQWRLCALTGGAVILMFLSALVTKGGPARIYLSLFAPAVFGVGAAAEELLTDSGKFKRIGLFLLLALAAMCVAFSDRNRKKAADPDLAVVFREVLKQDSHVFVSYKSSDLYVLRMLFADVVETDNCERQRAPGMLLILHDNAISAVHVEDPPVEELVPPGAAPFAEGRVVPKEDVLFWLYRLRPLRSGEPLDGKAVLCFASVRAPDDAKRWLLENFGVMNSMLFDPEASRICFAAPGNRLDAAALLKLEQDNPGTLFFRVVSD